MYLVEVGATIWMDGARLQLLGAGLLAFTRSNTITREREQLEIEPLNNTNHNTEHTENAGKLRKT